MFDLIEQNLAKIDFESISNDRQTELSILINYIQLKKDANLPINLNFICTHNSRRSQFSQLWAKIASQFFNINANCYSGGVEVTAFNERAVKSLENFGLKIDIEGTKNPKYTLQWSESDTPLVQFSKLYDDPSNPSSDFAAIMTCSHADENCPFIHGADERVPIRYDDPKTYDNTPLEKEMYDRRSFEIASEMMYVFSEIK
ncbi:MAG: protein-tyrosine-phosphatase [Crocinitomicaceae bacterium]